MSLPVIKKQLRIAHIHVADQHNKGDVAIVLAVQELLDQTFPGCLIEDFPVEVLKNYEANTLSRLNQSDLIVLGGGGIFYSYFLPFDLKIIKALKTPLIILGVGYIREVGAKALNQKQKESLVHLIKKATRVGVRENYTKKFLVKLGLAAQKIKVIGDPATLLKESKPRNFPLSNKLKIGFNLNYSGWLGFGKWREDILKAYQEVAAYFLKEYGAAGVDFFYLKHHPGEANIYPELKIKGLRVVDLKPAEQKYIYGQLDLVIGMMLHAGVMAFGAGTPEINVAYDLRNRNFAKFIGCPELVVELSDLQHGQLLRMVKRVIKEREYYRAKFVKEKNKINKRHQEFLREVGRLV